MAYLLCVPASEGFVPGPRTGVNNLKTSRAPGHTPAAGTAAAEQGPTPTRWGPAALAPGALAATVAASVSGRRLCRRSRVARGAEEGAVAAPPFPLESERGVDYTPLQQMLADGDFKAADAETRRLIIVLGGDAAVKRGWVYFYEIRVIPETDMITLDDLWSHYSDGKLGYAAQSKLWRQTRANFDKFALKVNWFTANWVNRNWPDDFIYDKSAPQGHLPLTNCIRGAQVLDEIMSHPAYDPKKMKERAAAKTKEAPPTASSKEPEVATESPASSEAPKKKKSALEMLAVRVPVKASPSAALAGATAPSAGYARSTQRQARLA